MRTVARRSSVTKARPAARLSPARRRPARRKAAQAQRVLSPQARRARAKFLRYFAKGFHDADYIDWERGYKWRAHERWEQELGQKQFATLLAAGDFHHVAQRAVAIESRTNLLFSFEKMALRDAVKSTAGARAFAQGLFDFLHGAGDLEERFVRWCGVVAALPRRQTRVLTWPLVTVFGFIAQPRTHFFLKPMVTKLAARRYGATFDYQSRPNWSSYASLLAMARAVRRDLRDLRPRDMIDVQSFLWVLGSEEYPA